MNATQALDTLAFHNVFLSTLSTRQLENYIDGSSTTTLQKVLEASRSLTRDRKAQRLAVECEAEIARRTRTRAVC